MARVTIEDCLEKVGNRFELSVAAMKRAKNCTRVSLLYQMRRINQ